MLYEVITFLVILNVPGRRGRIVSQPSESAFSRCIPGYGTVPAANQASASFGGQTTWIDQNRCAIQIPHSPVTPGHQGRTSVQPQVHVSNIVKLDR